MVADRLVAAAGGDFGSLHRALVAMIQRCERRVLVAKPQNYMNRSGKVIRQLLEWRRLEYSELLVIYDDVDLPFGRIRLRARGGSGGHNGMRSIIAELGSQDFARLRIGIGRKGPEPDLSSFVLDMFDEDERERLDSILKFVLRAVDSILVDGIEKSMTLYNRQLPIASPHNSQEPSDD